MLKRLKLSSLHPNPYRHFATYEIQKEKIATLVESINAAGFWGETVIARPAMKGGGYELAFGHHRWKAAQEVLGEDAMVELSVRELDNDSMLKMMARENNEIYDANAAQDIELVKAAIEAHAAGEIHMPKPDKNGLLASDYVNCQSTDSIRFTREALHQLFALDAWRIREALGHLKQMQAGLTDAATYANLSPTQAQELKTQVNRARVVAGPAVAKRTANRIASKLRDKTATSGRGSGTSNKRTAKQIADEEIAKATGKNTDLHKFVRRIESTRDLSTHRG